MSEAAWAERSLPAPSGGTSLLGRWEPATPSDLTVHRRELAAALQDGARPPSATDGAVERLLLVFEELASNALRHGRPPVSVQITTFDRFWLLDVADGAVDRPPVPAVGRDPARGGLGLHLVARICGACGWSAVRDRKHVWARIDYTRDEAPG